MGRWLDVLMVDSRRVPAAVVAQAARDLVAALVLRLYAKCGKDGKPVPLRHDAAGQLVNPVAGVYLFVSPVHTSGLQLFWTVGLVDPWVPHPNLDELAQRVSAAAGHALHLTYAGGCTSGTVRDYAGGRLRKVWGGRGEANTHRLAACLRRYFLLNFRQFDGWLDEWNSLHSFADLWAPACRGRMDATLQRLTGRTEAEWVAAYRAGAVAPDDPHLRTARFLSEHWAAYDEGRYPSSLYELASGAPDQEGAVLREPRLLTPEEWFALQQRFKAAQSDLSAPAATGL